MECRVKNKWRAIASMKDKQWDRFKFMMKCLLWLAIISLFVMVIFMSPEHIESLGKGLSILLPFAL